MKIGDLFTRADLEPQPCAHCTAPVVEVDGGAVHFEADDNGAKTAWTECYTIGARGRRKYTGTVAEAAA